MVLFDALVKREKKVGRRREGGKGKRLIHEFSHGIFKLLDEFADFLCNITSERDNMSEIMFESESESEMKNEFRDSESESKMRNEWDIHIRTH
jgi:hypothetical protein